MSDRKPLPEIAFDDREDVPYLYKPGEGSDTLCLFCGDRAEAIRFGRLFVRAQKLAAYAECQAALELLGHHASGFGAAGLNDVLMRHGFAEAGGVNAREWVRRLRDEALATLDL